MENEIPPQKSSKVGCPFWIPTILTVVPFTILFLHFVPKDVSLPWWKIIMAGVIGLMPAMVLGLIVQTLWAIVIAVAKGNFILLDFFFALLLLAFCAGLTWFNFKEGVMLSETEIWVVFIFVLTPLIGFYVRKRIKQKDE
jgi:hypothetical protein